MLLSAGQCGISADPRCAQLVARHCQPAQLINHIIISGLILLIVFTVSVTALITTTITMLIISMAMILLLLMFRLNTNAGHSFPRPRSQISLDSTPLTRIGLPGVKKM
jgi:predicted Na+-dependent transporter